MKPRTRKHRRSRMWWCASGAERPKATMTRRSLTRCWWHVSTTPIRGAQGYRDALHIINKIYHHYSACAVIGNRWEVLYPMEWTTQEEDTHPYYFTAMSLRIQAPAVHKEVPEA